MNWETKTLGEIVDPCVGQTGPDAVEFTYINIGSIDRETKRIINPKVLPKTKTPSRARRRLKAGDVLVSMTRPNLNAVALVPPGHDGAIGSTGFHVRATDALPAYLFYAVQTPGFVDAMCRKVQGALYPAVRPRDIAGYSIPLPDKTEQRRIVAEIEKQFTRLDAGVAALRRVQANLKRYRTAVLKAVCEGRLVPTEAELARKENRPFETGEQLLQRIPAERRKNWSGRGKYKEASAVIIADLPQIPDEWTWASVKQIGEATTGFTPPKGNERLFGGDIPFFKPTDLDAGYHIRKFHDSLTKAGAKHGRLLPARSILATCIGATISKTGLARVECATNQQINALIVPNDFLSPEYVFWFISSPLGQQNIISNASATTLPILNKSKFEALPIPLPPLSEQTRIVAEVERRLSMIDELETAVIANLARAIRLRRSILNEFFSSGK